MVALAGLRIRRCRRPFTLRYPDLEMIQKTSYFYSKAHLQLTQLRVNVL